MCATVECPALPSHNEFVVRDHPPAVRRFRPGAGLDFEVAASLFLPPSLAAFQAHRFFPT